ncbi:MAG TPA: hypothetical protein VJ838_05315 [Gaiellaceae bacterium]|nr:hypothetical protein [Gaiellaceae bacterium]
MYKHLGTYMASAAVVLVAAVFALPAFAGNKGGGSTTTSSIKVASIDGAAAPLSPTTKIGDTMSFATTVQPLAGWQHPMVAVTCYQDVNGDGVVDTSVSGPDIVYSQLETPSTTFTLGGYASIWTMRGGGAATCRADLDSYGFKSGVEYVNVLATTGNWQS